MQGSVTLLGDCAREYSLILPSHLRPTMSCSLPRLRKNQELGLLLKWPQCTLFNDFGTLCCNKIKKKSTKSKYRKFQVFFFFFKVLQEKSCNQGNLFIMKHYFPLCFITNCNLLNKPKWRWYCSTANIPHTVLSTTAGGGCAGKQQPPANKDTLTIQTLKECLYTWNLNIYIYRKKKI